MRGNCWSQVIASSQGKNLPQSKQNKKDKMKNEKVNANSDPWSISLSNSRIYRLSWSTKSNLTISKRMFWLQEIFYYIDSIWMYINYKYILKKYISLVPCLFFFVHTKGSIMTPWCASLLSNDTITHHNNQMVSMCFVRLLRLLTQNLSHGQLHQPLIISWVGRK